MAEPYITIRGLRKSYVMGANVIHALDGLDVEIERNAFIAVTGPSGSGKSTLLHMLGGLDRPTAGSIAIDGTSLETMDEHALGEDRRGRVGLATHAAHRPSELSGGQQQRVAVARALANEAGLILADEPTGNLDTQSGAHIMRLLDELHRQGRTLLGVSHDPGTPPFASRVTKKPPPSGSPRPTVTPTLAPRPILLINGYNVDVAPLKPGSVFNLEVRVSNVGGSEGRWGTLI